MFRMVEWSGMPGIVYMVAFGPVCVGSGVARKCPLWSAMAP